MKILCSICCRLPSVKEYMRKITSVRCLTFGFLLFSALLATAENPRWVWHDTKKAIQTNEVRFFRKTFMLERKPAKAILKIAADDEAIIYINGKEIAHCEDYDKPVSDEVTSHLK